MSTINLQDIAIHFIVYLILLLHHSPLAQSISDFEIVNYSNSENIHEASATCLYEDSKGYIWIATTFDMMRYDGNEFTFIDIPQVNIFESIYAISEYNNKILAFLSSSKVLVFDPENITTGFEEITIDDKFVMSFRHHNNQNIITTYKNGLYFFHDFKFEKINNSDIRFTSIRSFGSQNDKYLYYVSGNDIYRLEGNNLRHFFKLNINDICYANKLPGEKFLIITDEYKQLVYDPQTQKSTPVTFGQRTDPTMLTYVDRKNRLWIAANSSLYLCSESIPTPNNIKEIISDIAVSYFYEDSNNNLWVTTSGNGVFFLKENKFATYGTKDGLPGNNFFPFCEFQNKIWTASLSGIGVFENNKWKEVKSTLDAPIVYTVNFFNYKNNLYVKAMNRKSGLNDVYLYKNNQFHKTNIIPSYKKRIFSFVNMNNDELWGFDFKHRIIKVQNGIAIPLEIEGFPRKSMLSDLKYDNNKNLWISTFSHGVFKYSDNNLQVYDTTNGLNNNQVSDFCFDNNNNVWFATFNGINKLNENGTWQYFTENDGLSHNICYSILADSNYIYIGTHNGINVFDGTSFLRYYTEDGTSSNETSGKSIMKSSDGNIWFGTTRGITLYKPKNDINLSKSPMRWQIDLHTKDSLYTYSCQTNTTLSKIELSPSALPMTISSSAIRYSGDAQYEYSITYNDGSELKTIELEDNSITISSLKQGNSEITINTKSKNRDRSIDSLIVPVYLRKHTLLSGFVYYSILVFILTSTLFIIYRNRKKEESEEKKKNSKGLLTNQLRINEIQASIEQKLVEEKAYLDPQLTLAKSADLLGEPKEYISHVINIKYQLNFNELINSHRIKELQMKLRDPDNAELTILEMAYECGFNSKSAFNLVFKKQTGITPSQYREQLNSISG